MLLLDLCTQIGAHWKKPQVWQPTRASTLVNDRKNGTFFTPDALADSVVEYVLNNLSYQDSRKLSILEPSAGEGAFLRAISRKDGLSKRIRTVDAVEIEPRFIEACRDIVIGNADVVFHCSDFIVFPEAREKYDIIVGNPPYISYKHLSGEQISACREYFLKYGIPSSDFRNAWTLFLLKSSNLLKPDGLMAFVLPKEVLYVNHASWLRSKLLQEFSRVDVFLFDKLHFDHADQDVAVLICQRKHESPGLHIADNCDTQLNNKDMRLIEVGSFYGSKWSQFKISDHENALLGECTSEFRPVKAYCTAVAGIVPAANSFFIINQERAAALDLRKFAIPIVQKSNYLSNRIILDNSLMLEIINSGRPAYLIADYDHNAPPPEVLKYLQIGESQNLHKRYKMTTREPWHKIPGIWPSEAIFFKRIAEVPKFALNSARALVTDTAYRITPNEGVDLRSLIFSFYNSATMVAAELRGRTYGGGVLELTPNEFKGLPIPYESVTEEMFKRFAEHLGSAPFSEVLAEQDNYLLTRAGMTQPDIATLQSMRHKLHRRRMKKGRQKG